jgi:hypothetical protein
MSRATSVSGPKPAGRTPSRKRTKAASAVPAAIADERLHAAIAEAAYYRAEKRGFEPGHELDDWLAAEMEIAALRATKSDGSGASRQGAS